MNRPRVIPILLLKNGGLVKTVCFKDDIYVGDPINAVRIFNEKQVDELIVLDIDATRRGSGPNFSAIRDMAEECFMPLCYGGGVSNLTEVETLFEIGVEKISFNTACLDSVNLVQMAANKFGSQSIVASIDVKKNILGKSTVYSHSKRKVSQSDPVAFARYVEGLGVGEVLLTSVDRDGQRAGYDLELIEKVSSAVSIPVIAAGGAGCLNDFRNVLLSSGASAAAGGSFFVLHGKHRAVLITYPIPETITRLVC